MEDDYEDPSFRELGAKTARRGTVFLAGKLASALISLAILVYLTRALKPIDYGLYTIVMAYSLVLGMGGNFGMGTAFRKILPEHASNPDLARKVISNGFFLSVSVALAIAIAGIAASPYIALHVYGNALITLPLMIAAGSVVLSVIFNAAVAALVGMHRVVKSTIANIVYAVSQLVLVVLLVSLGYGILGAMVAYALSVVLGSAVALAYMAAQLGVRIARIEKKVLGEITKFSAPIVVSNVAMFGMMNFAPLLLGLYASAYVVGNYGVAFRGSRFIDLLITSITFVLLPAFSSMLSSKELREKAERAINSSIFYTFLLLLPIVAYIVGGARPVVSLLFSKSYTLAPIYVSIALVGIVLEVIWSISGTLVIGHGNTRRFMQYQLAIVAMELVALLIFVPFYKAYGALLAIFIITPIFAGMLYMRLLRKEFGIRISLSKPARIAISAAIIAVMLAVITFAMHQSKYALVVNLVVLAIVYPPLLALFKAVEGSNVKFIEDTLKGMGRPGRWTIAYLDYAKTFMRRAEDPMQRSVRE
ncbi:MAG: oligosaccharide flippase family protein [Candidatus Micrarchaeaceae archaeon]